MKTKVKAMILGVTGTALLATALPASARTVSTQAALGDAATVHTDSTLATVSTGIGINDIVFDPNMHAAGAARALRADRLRIRSLDSGAWTDVYRWRTNSFDSDPITDGEHVTQPTTRPAPATATTVCCPPAAMPAPRTRLASGSANRR